MKALTLRISGRVQGVGYRDAMIREACRLGLVGWVRNRLDGTVEAYVSGEETAVDALASWARSGPPAARVTGVDVNATGATSERLHGFQMRGTS